MKELTIEQKAQRYDEAIERARLVLQERGNEPDGASILSELFPELKESKESEDEKIRKRLISYFQSQVEVYKDEDMEVLCTYNKWIAWLEKQGEHANFRNKIQVGDKVTRNEDGVLVNLSQLNRVAKKQSEQKPTDNVEPKFHEGDWITNGDYTWEIVEVKPLDYILQSQDGNIVDDTISHVDEQFHSFTIQDAKGGDVLVCEDFGYTSLMLFKSFSNGRISLHCWYNSQTNIFHINTDVALRKDANIHPATKEQRDTLKKAMADAGYTFDFEKKELKKIEQKPAWSEEDEKEVAVLEAYIRGKDWSDRHIDRALGIVDELVNKVKSLKDRYTWKPSDEQMDAINDAIDYLGGNTKIVRKHLMSLYEQLKKLKA